MSRSLLTRLFDRINRRIDWHRLPKWLGILNLIAFRDVLRSDNLHATWTPGALKRRADGEQIDPALIRYRTPDGSYNDLEYPEMGKAGTRFGRNVPFEHAHPATGDAFLTPNPREISRRLMRRDEFKPALSLNLLAAAWIQFQTHDWFNHARDHSTPLEVALPEGDDWFESPMRFPRTMPDQTRCAEDCDLPPTFINTESHWWDASAIYGSTKEKQALVRSFTDGKLIVRNGRLPLDAETGHALTGFNENWWVGLGLLHTLFTAEHNAICDRLKDAHPSWSDDELFGTAQLINAALMAKIHTVEWTPAIIAHPALKIGMRANWWGLAEERVHRMFGRISKSEVISGIPGSEADHHGAPYQLTEEFVSVYRLHQLIPDEVPIYSAESGELMETLPFREVALRNAEKVIDRGFTASDLWYSFGVQHPGAITMHNFPRFLTDLTLPDGVRLDLSVVDIMRDRERGVPRYNQFRRSLHLKPAASFEDLAAKPEWAQELREVYGDIELVDLQVGMAAETPPRGFGFSDTAFRVFILMASRRLKSDRFLTSCYTAEYYTQIGLDWIAESDMKAVVLRHYPELAPSLHGVENAFAPWRSLAGSGVSDRRMGSESTSAAAD
jgi:hypothetical protein